MTALSKQSSSPVLKSSLTITGSNFGTDRDTTEVYLVRDGQRKYFLNIVTITDTQIEVILGGGITANYDVVVVNKLKGQSVPNDNSKFSYKIVVNSLSITEGHLGGGYDLTITGYNFAPTEKGNLVFIGNAANNLC